VNQAYIMKNGNPIKRQLSVIDAN